MGVRCFIYKKPTIETWQVYGNQCYICSVLKKSIVILDKVLDVNHAFLDYPRKCLDFSVKMGVFWGERSQGKEILWHSHPFGAFRI